MYSEQGIFQHHIQCKKVRTILDKTWYIKSICRSFKTLKLLAFS
jgi:hypothetical protein